MSITYLDAEPRSHQCSGVLVGSHDSKRILQIPIDDKVPCNLSSSNRNICRNNISQQVNLSVILKHMSDKKKGNGYITKVKWLTNSLVCVRHPSGNLQIHSMSVGEDVGLTKCLAIWPDKDDTTSEAWKIYIYIKRVLFYDRVRVSIISSEGWEK